MVELNHKQVRKQINITIPKKTCTLDEVLSQTRIVKSFEVAIACPERNIYFINPPNNCEELIYALIKRFDKKPVPNDLVCVNNFKNITNPMCISLPKGYATQLEEDMRDFKNKLLCADKDITKSTLKDFKKDFLSLKKLASKLDLKIEMKNPFNYTYAPKKVLTQDMQGAFEKKAAQFQEQIVKQFIKKIVHKKLKNKDWEDYLEDAIDDKMKSNLTALKDKYSKFDQVVTYLQGIEFHMFDKKNILSDDEKADPCELLVNILVDNKKYKRAPIIIEDKPSYDNLIGKLQEKLRLTSTTDGTAFLKINAGSLVKANGGYLVVNIDDLFRDQTGGTAFEAIRSALLTKRIKIENSNGSILGESITPQDIQIDTKVIFTGSQETYSILCSIDPDFRKLFEEHADFARKVTNSKTNQTKYCGYLKQVTLEKKWLNLSSSAYCALLEQSCRLIDDQKYISTDLDSLISILEEANLNAKKSAKKVIKRKDIEDTIMSQFLRKNLVYEKEKEFIKNWTYLSVSGKKVGQINGLVVSEANNVTFGVPERITAKVGVGNSGILYPDIEAELTGPILNKSVHIIDGYLTGKYCKDKPLQISARITFEQCYEQVEGDSASSTTIYALLSALSKVPIKQNIAVTGSVDEFGNVQIIGGVNNKIEGFYDICKKKGPLSGEQGVMIPKHNMSDLMLRPDIVNAVKEGKFHIYAVKSIDEGLEILTGMPAKYVHKKANAEIERLGTAYEKFGKNKKKE